ncbi:hypothetical protein SAY86_014031 [Trapa natans]|uniref:Uncharacterized protein n=1 Tax=Trapa natans TaxID=22666 RepID=A0AAN7KSD4_TRANT|nr:hypothetical protein SAY86_014031 [Trapa natans]
MPWCIPRNLVPVTESVIKVVKESCYLEKESIVVVKDRSGYTRNPNAMNMISLWGSEAFPFTPLKEHELWSARKDSWFELVVSGCHREISTAITSMQHCDLMLECFHGKH